MRLLIVTQKVDMQDATLGFFHSWLIAFASKCESIVVICLEEGEHHLPENIRVFSLGKQKDSGSKKTKYILNFYKILFSVLGSYDKVFVHMNQEYILLAGLYWKYKKIPVYFWRNHPNGSFLTYVAVWLSSTVFCTSLDSFTARFKKTKIMPVGVDTNVFKPLPNVLRKKYSVCMIGRIAPIKHIELGLEAVKVFVSSGGQISFSVIGPVLAKDVTYYENLKTFVSDNNLSSYVHFTESVSPEKLPEIYSSHEICLNLTEAGSFDKTIVEAAACGAVPIVSSKSLGQMLPAHCLTEPTAEAISNKLQYALIAHVHSEIILKMEKFVEAHSLSVLMDNLFQEINYVQK